jgi:hypothetical protein
MKLTTEKLKNLILEVLNEQGKRQRVLDILLGQDPSVDTVAVMSGQNPMATAVGAGVNDRLQKELESELRSRGYEVERIGGIFGGISEKSVLIKNARMADMDELNRQFQQWGFVFGEKNFKPTRGSQGELTGDESGIDGEHVMEFQMYKVDYDQEHGFDADSAGTSQVMHGKQLAGVDDNFSYIPGQGESGKILIPLYGAPVPAMTAQQIEAILADLNSPSQYSGS